MMSKKIKTMAWVMTLAMLVAIMPMMAFADPVWTIDFAVEDVDYDAGDVTVSFVVKEDGSAVTTGETQSTILVTTKETLDNAADYKTVDAGGKIVYINQQTTDLGATNTFSFKVPTSGFDWEAQSLWVSVGGYNVAAAKKVPLIVSAAAPTFTLATNAGDFDDNNELVFNVTGDADDLAAYAAAFDGVTLAGNDTIDLSDSTFAHTATETTATLTIKADPATDLALDLAKYTQTFTFAVLADGYSNGSAVAIFDADLTALNDLPGMESKTASDIPATGIVTQALTATAGVYTAADLFTNTWDDTDTEWIFAEDATPAATITEIGTADTANGTVTPVTLTAGAYTFDQDTDTYFVVVSYTVSAAPFNDITLKYTMRIEGSEAPAYIRGDLDGNGDIDIDDVTALFEYVGRGTMPVDSETNEEYIDARIQYSGKLCDDGDEINIDDVTALFEYVGRGTPFPIED